MNDTAGPLRVSALLSLVVVLTSCGGSGDGGGTDSSAFPASSTYARRCATPRIGNDPFTGKAYTDVQGTATDEKAWLRSWTSELYLWYREVTYSDPAADVTVPAYFEALKTHATTASGKDKDGFHYTYPTAIWESLAQSGVAPGYGAQWLLLSAKPPRQVVVAYVEPGSPAADAGIGRGAQVTAIDGVDVAYGSDVDTLNAGLSPSGAGETHTFALLDRGADPATTTPRDVELTSANVESKPVQDIETIDTGSGIVGYMLFNDHLATAEAALVAAVAQLRDAGVSDLVLDIRYNGGGYLAIASELAYMIAGPGPTAGKTFEQQVFNDRYPTENPVTHEPQRKGFLASTQGYSMTAGQPLPYLGLPRVFVLTGPNTCSASESVINGLRGVDVQVIQIGATTCGKPYGFYPQDNCGTTYFSIEFQGVNAKGFGDYSDGFTPGCAVADDLNHDLGDVTEARLAAALAYRATGACPTAASSLAPGASALTLEGRQDGVALKSLWQENRIVAR